MDTRSLKYLMAVTRHGHFGKASRELGISQPNLSKSIQRLEASLGVKLLDRSRRKVTVTPIGQAVVKRAQRLVADADDLRREVDLLLGAEIGTLSIGIGPAMGETYISAAIARIAEQHPTTRIIVRSDHWKQLSAWLFDGQLDICAADISELKDNDHVTVIPLPPERLVWFCRPSHPLATIKRVTRKDLLAYPLATPKMPSWAVEWFASVDRDGSLCARGSYATVECESYSVLKRMVLASNCISAALHSTIAEELDSGTLVAIPVKSPSIKTNAGLVRLSDRPVSPLADALVNEVVRMTTSDRS